MPSTHTFRRALAATIASLNILLAASSMEAATITWGAATGISADSDVSTTGTLVGAFNLGGAGAGNPTVNGVTFDEFAFGYGASTAIAGDYAFSVAGPTLAFMNAVGSVNAPFSGLSAEYQALLGTIAGNAVSSDPITLTITGLVAGASYEFQWWTNASIFLDPIAVTAAAGDTVTLFVNNNLIDGDVGQFAIGTFIADNTSQIVTFGSPNGTVAINAFQLRETLVQASAPGSDLNVATPVPEPGSALAGMLALGLCGARFGRRSRQD